MKSPKADMASHKLDQACEVRGGATPTHEGTCVELAECEARVQLVENSNGT